MLFRSLPPLSTLFLRVINRLLTYVKNGWLYYAIAWKVNRMFNRVASTIVPSPDDYREQLVIKIHRRAYRFYKPMLYKGNVTLFVRTPTFWVKNEWHLHWRTWITGQFTAVQIPGDHMNLLEEPQVKEIAQRILDILK